MRLHYIYSTHVDFHPGIGRHNILLRCQPCEEAWQHIVSERLYIDGDFWIEEGHDGFGNRIITGGTEQQHSTLQYTSSGVVELTTYCIPESMPHPMFFLTSRLTMTDASMQCLLPVLSGRFLDDCLAIMHATHRQLTYTPNVTTMQTTAMEVFCSRRGVCQDYAHLMIALCRMAGMAARYVCGLMVGEGVTHAWVEVHDGQCWYAFDPTNDTAIASGYIKLAHGRDAMDCPVSRGTYIGITTQTTTVAVRVSPPQSPTTKPHPAPPLGEGG